MLNTKPFLCFDFGAGSVKVAEFVTNEAGTLALTQFGLKGLGQEGMQESKREAAVLKAIQELLSQKPYRGKQTNVCAPGYHVFSKFVKLPPVDSSKVTQIIQYEAQQNVPFPLEEVVWDYQIMGTTGSGELEVLLVAIKSDVVEGLFRTAEASNVRLQLVDVSPAALCNAFRFNYGDEEGCTMLLDIGATVTVSTGSHVLKSRVASTTHSCPVPAWICTSNCPKGYRTASRSIGLTSGPLLRAKNRLNDFLNKDAESPPAMQPCSRNPDPGSSNPLRLRCGTRRHPYPPYRLVFVPTTSGCRSARGASSGLNCFTSTFEFRPLVSYFSRRTGGSWSGLLST